MALRPPAAHLGFLLAQQEIVVTGAVDVGGGKIPGVARFSWTQGSARDLRGFTMDDARAPLDAVVSPSFLASVGASVGDEVPVSVPGGSFAVRVTGTAGYFPTLDPNARPFILMDLQALVDRLNLGQMSGMCSGRSSGFAWQTP